MKDIEFRAKSIEYKDWISGYLVKGETGNYYICKNLSHAFIWIDEKTIGQYTGLKDKNGTKIFEGDIVESEYRVFKAKVEWNESFCGFFPFCNIQAGIYADECEVIGNIYDESDVK